MKRGWKSQGELFNMYKYLQGGHKEEGDSGFQWCLVTETMGTNWNTGGSLRTSVKKKKVFPVRVTEHWHRFPKEIFESWSLEIIESCLDIVVGGLFSSAELGQGLGPDDLQWSLPTSTLLWFCCGGLCNYSSIICFNSLFSVICLLGCLD